MIKKLFLALVVLVVVLVLAAVALVLFVDVNRFKPQIESLVAEQTGRNLSIDGDLSLSLFPRLALSLPPTTLSEPDGQGQPFSIQGASVGVAVMPLLSGSLQAEVVRLEGLRAKLVIHEDGSTSIDDLIGAGGEAAPGGSGEPPAEGGGRMPLNEIRIGGLEIVDAAVTVDDRQRGDTIQVTGLALTAGEIADGVTTPVTLTAALSGTAPPMQLDVRMEGELTPDLATPALTAPTLATEVRGTLDGMAIEQTQAVAGLRADATAVTADMFTLTAGLDQPGQRQVGLRLASPLSVRLAGPVITLSGFEGEVKVDDRAVAPEPLTLPYGGELKADIGAESVALTLRVDAPDTKLNAKADVTGFARPRVRFDLDADRIDVDRYLPPAGADPGAAPQAGGGTGGDSLFAGVDDIPIDLSALEGLDLAGKARIGELKASGLTVSSIAASLKAADSAFMLESMTAQLYGGRFDLRGRAVRAGNRFTATSNLVGINVETLLKALTGDALLEGRGDVAFDLSAAGETVGAVRRSLDGAIRFALADGAIVGINLGQKLREARAAIQGGKASAESFDRSQKTDFAALGGSFAVNKGVLSNDNLEGKSPLFRLGGKGIIDLVREVLDYRVEASVVATSKGQGGAELEALKGLTVPVQLSGALVAPQWEIDWGSVAEQALKTQAGEKLRQEVDARKAELEAKVDAREEELKAKAREKVEEKVGEKLKGLLGR